MEKLATHKGWTIARNPHGLIVATKTDKSFPFIANSIDHARIVIDEREAM